MPEKNTSLVLILAMSRKRLDSEKANSLERLERLNNESNSRACKINKPKVNNGLKDQQTLF
jgi:hypothetical protein